MKKIVLTFFSLISITAKSYILWWCIPNGTVTVFDCYAVQGEGDCCVDMTNHTGCHIAYDAQHVAIEHQGCFCAYQPGGGESSELFSAVTFYDNKFVMASKRFGDANFDLIS